jgi:signal transduction histidine kinase/ActR/RegA family two-component response regulator
LRRFRLRTKFLLALLVITAALTSATLLIVSYSVEKRVRKSLQEDLYNSVKTYQSFDHQRQDILHRSAELLANLPNVRALMTSRDAATIQDASADIWQQSGSDLLVLAGNSGELLGFQTNPGGLKREMAQTFLRRSLAKQAVRAWWFGGGHLYEVWIQAIYFGPSSDNTTIGFLVVGHEINTHAAQDFSNIAASEVAFYSGDTLVASTLPPDQQPLLTQELHGLPAASAGVPQELKLGTERYFATTVSLSPKGDLPVSLTVLKSVDKATQFLNDLNHILIGLGLLSVLAGSVLVFMIAHSFTRPLGNLVVGVRALEKGDFTHALDVSGGGEVAEVTAAFDRMRNNLQKTQNEQKLLEERLRQAQKMEAIGRLAGGVAHDFNNLLTIINGNSDLLIDRDGADDFHRHCIGQIQKASGRAVAMTRQLLAFSRMQVLQPRIVDLNGIVADMGKMLPRLIGEHIEFSFVPEQQQSPVKADPGQIEQVIMNLAVNSRDAMPDGGKLSVRTRNLVIDQAEAAKRSPMKPGPFVLLSVTDTGQGMDAETKAHIFEPFFTTKEVGKGTGLGLATVYGVVKQSDGFIWVESAPGKGTTFEIYLPLASGSVFKPEAGAKLPAIPRGTETILVVEDEAGVRELASRFLKGKGYSVLEAKDGLEALEISDRYADTIHLVLSDIVMPRMGGTELAERLRARHPNMKIVFMSGYSEYSNRNQMQIAPTVAVLQKPFSPTSLLEIVHDTLVEKSAGRIVNSKECPVV